MVRLLGTSVPPVVAILAAGEDLGGVTVWSLQSEVVWPIGPFDILEGRDPESRSRKWLVAVIAILMLFKRITATEWSPTRNTGTYVGRMGRRSPLSSMVRLSICTPKATRGRRNTVTESPYFPDLENG
jgi:hypothetical protein